MKKIRDNHGITLISLAVTIVIMMILAVSLTASMTSTIELKKYNSVKEDIIALTEEVKVYYIKNLSLPVYNETTIDIPNKVYEKDRNPNDSGNYYPINVDVLSSDLSLNLGEGNKKQNFTTDDLYVVNEKSLTVYYVQGAMLDGERHYTIVDDFSGGSFAEEYYSKVDLPIISVVTMESNGANKSRAGLGDTITLKILTNYELTTKPTVTINGETVEVTWNGQRGTATYVLPWKTESNYEYGEKISLSISNYSADGRTGETITDVNFGQGVYAYAKNLVELYKRGIIKTGDYLNYSDYVNAPNTYTSVTTENGWADQTYSVDTTTQWRVLGLSQDETQLMLISADPIQKNMDESSENSWDKDPYLYMKGAYSYVNCVKMLNNISGIYSTSLGKARSITADDINNILGVTVASDKVYYTSDSTQTNIDVSMNTEDWLGLGSTYIYKSTDYSPESYINGKTNATEGESVTQNGYFYDCTSKMNETIGKTTLGELLFEGTTETYNLSKSYWLASNRTFCNLSNAYFGPGFVDSGCVGAGSGMFVSNGYWIALKSAVRPVVCLNPDITVNQLHVIDGELETWTYDNSFWMEGGITTGEAGNHGN